MVSVVYRSLECVYVSACVNVRSMIYQYTIEGERSYLWNAIWLPKAIHFTVYCTVLPA